jgi:hypothetical protein
VVLGAGEAAVVDLRDDRAVEDVPPNRALKMVSPITTPFAS